MDKEIKRLVKVPSRKEIERLSKDICSRLYSYQDGRLQKCGKPIKGRIEAVFEPQHLVHFLEDSKREIKREDGSIANYMFRGSHPDYLYLTSEEVELLLGDNFWTDSNQNHYPSPLEINAMLEADYWKPRDANAYLLGQFERSPEYPLTFWHEVPIVYLKINYRSCKKDK